MDKTVVTRLKLEIAGYLAPLAKAEAATVGFGKKVGGAVTTASHGLGALGPAALAAGGAMAAGLGLAVKAAVGWETAWAGVTKTVSGTKSQMADLEVGLRGLATTLPASHKEIAGVAEAAGQLGIQRSAIVEFTKTMVALGVSTNLSAEDAATGIAKIMNVMQTPQAEVGRFGATLVALGNVGASTESEILEMASRLAGAGKLVGASESDVLALANAMTSMGIEAQLGGGAFSRVMLKIFSAVKDGGDKLKGFADVAGMSGQKFAREFGKEPIEAIDGLIHGLDRIDKSGGNVIAVLRDLGFKGTQDLQVLLKLKGSGDLLHQSLVLGSKAWQDNTALVNEANKRYATTASQLQILRNNAVDVGIKIGGVLLPALKSSVSVANTMVSGFGALPPVVHGVAAGFGALATAGLGFVGILGTFGPKIHAFIDNLSQMGSIGGFVAGNLGTISGVLAVAGAALAVYTYIVGQNAKAQAAAAQRTSDLADAISKQGKDIGRATDSLKLEAVFGKAGDKGHVGDSLRTFGHDLGVLTQAMNKTGPSAADMRKDLSDLELGLRRGYGLKSFNELLTQDNALLKGTQLNKFLLDLSKSGDITAGDMARLVARIREQNAAWEAATIAARDKAAADAAVALSSDGAAGGSAKLATAFQSQAAAANAAKDAIKEMVDAELAAFDPVFGMIDAVKENNDAQDSLNAAIKQGKGAKDLAPLYLAVAKSALQLDGAATTLAGSIKTGGTNVDLLKLQLQEWVDNGMIPAGVAIKILGGQIDTAVAKADHFAGDRVANLIAVDKASPVIDPLLAKLSIWKTYDGSVLHLRVQTILDNGDLPIGNSKTDPFNGGKIFPGTAKGGWAGTGQPMQGPTGTDRIPTFLSDGEFVVREPVARTMGPALEQLNATGRLPMAGATMANTAAQRYGPASAGPRGGIRSAPEAVHHELHVRNTLDVTGGNREFVTWLRQVIRAEGGDVQVVLGARGR